MFSRVHWEYSRLIQKFHQNFSFGIFSVYIYIRYEDLIFRMQDPIVFHRTAVQEIHGQAQSRGCHLAQQSGQSFHLYIPSQTGKKATVSHLKSRFIPLMVQKSKTTTWDVYIKPCKQRVIFTPNYQLENPGFPNHQQYVKIYLMFEKPCKQCDIYQPQLVKPGTMLGKKPRNPAFWKLQVSLLELHTVTAT